MKAAFLKIVLSLLLCSPAIAQFAPPSPSASVTNFQNIPSINWGTVTGAGYTMQGISFYDGFQRANTLPGSVGTSPQRYVWPVYGPFVSSFPLPASPYGQIVSNHVQSPTGNTIYLGYQASNNISACGGNISFLPGNGGTQVGAVTFALCANANYVQLMAEHVVVTTNQMAIYYRNANVFELVAAVPVRIPADGSSHPVVVAVNGDQIFASVDNVKFSFYETNANQLVGPYAFVEISYNNASTFLCAAQIDSFWAGSTPSDLVAGNVSSQLNTGAVGFGTNAPGTITFGDQIGVQVQGDFVSPSGQGAEFLALRPGYGYPSGLIFGTAAGAGFESLGNSQSLKAIVDGTYATTSWNTDTSIDTYGPFRANSGVLPGSVSSPTIAATNSAGSAAVNISPATGYLAALNFNTGAGASVYSPGASQEVVFSVSGGVETLVLSNNLSVRMDGSVLLMGASPPSSLPPAAAAGYGQLWNSNSALYWITSTHTNYLAGP